MRSRSVPTAGKPEYRTVDEEGAESPPAQEGGRAAGPDDATLDVKEAATALARAAGGPAKASAVSISDMDISEGMDAARNEKAVGRAVGR